MSEWTNEFPTKPGWYWFYGWAWGRDENSKEKPQLRMMKASVAVEGEILLTTDNSFIFKPNCQGMFYKASPPELPELD